MNNNKEYSKAKKTCIMTVQGIELLHKKFRNRLMLDYPIFEDTTLKIGKNAEAVIEVNNVQELKDIVLFSKENGIQFKVFGHGTNIFIQDEGVPGIVVKLKGDFLSVYYTEKCKVSLGAGCPLSFLIREAIERELTGPEILIGIPGTVGGALVGNSGGKEGSISDLVEMVTIMTSQGQVESRTVDDLEFGYRKSGIKPDEIVLDATFGLHMGTDINIRIKSIWDKRRGNQPLGEKTAGCVFKNPEGNFAGKLIEEVGLKGYKMGNVKISDKNANFFINTGGGTSKDFLSLMKFTQEKVKSIKGVELYPEIMIF